MEPDITVVIPAAGRPQFLSCLLDSIWSQTAVDRVAEIIVSEDSENQESRNIVAKFKKLPIRYVFRKSPLGFLGHHKALLCDEARSPLTALLHDDDWWAPHHLETACLSLDNNADCAAVFANIYDSYGPQYPMEMKFHNFGWRAWVGAGCNFNAKVVALDLIGVLLSSLLDAAFHFSTLVGRSRAISDAFMEVVATNNGYDCDRTFPVLLAERRKIHFATTPSAFIRVHPGQLTRSFLTMNEPWKISTTRNMVARWPRESRQAAERLNEAAATMDPEILKVLSATTLEPLRDLLIDECGFHLYRANSTRNTKWLVKQFAPPIIGAVRHWLSSQTARLRENNKT